MFISDLFQIVPRGIEAGDIYLVSELDFETTPTHIFEVCASNPTDPSGAPTSPTATQTVTVSIVNENDNWPQCVSCPAAVSVDENAGIG